MAKYFFFALSLWVTFFSQALAQNSIGGNSFATGVPGQTVPGAVTMCLDATGKALPNDVAGINCSGGAGPVPAGATSIAATSGNVANATATATLVAAVAKRTYISGFQISGSGATVGLIVNCTVTNIIGSITLNYPYAASVGALLGNSPIIVNFNPPIPASANNTAIVVSCPALGAGNTNNSVNAFGYQL